MKSAPPRILMLTAHYPPLVYGGAERQCQKLCAELSAMGAEITVLTSRPNFRVPAKSQEGRIVVRRCFVSGAPPELIGRYCHASLFWAVAVFSWVGRHASEFDVIHVHQLKFSAYVAAWLKACWKIPIIVKPGNAGEHSDFIRLGLKRFIGPHLVATTLPAMDRVVAITDEIRAEALAAGVSPRRVASIPNGVVQPEFPEGVITAKRKQKASYEVPADVPLFMFAGRLESVKNLMALLEGLALASARTSRPLRLWIVGDGSESASLTRKAVELGIADSVTFWGKRDELGPMFQAADHVVLASVAEGLSNMLLEGMAAGAVPVMTPVSGAAQLAQSGRTGFVAKGFSPEAIAEAIGQALALDSTRRAAMSEAAYALIATEYRIETVARKYLELYDELRN